MLFVIGYCASLCDFSGILVNPSYSLQANEDVYGKEISMM